MASKPLQYINSKIIAQQEKSNENQTLIIVNMFYAAKDVVRNIEIYDKEWSNVSFAKNRFTSHLACAVRRPDVVYTDGDIGLRLFIYLMFIKAFNHKCKIFVYEEGVGTYRNDIYSSGVVSHFKKFIFKMCGVGWYFGGSMFAEGIYVRDASRYLANLPRSEKFVKIIDESVQEYCENNFDKLSNIFGKFFDEKNCWKKNHCAIYLSDWHWSEQRVSESLREFRYDLLIIKPHPNIAIDIKHQFIDAKICAPSIPAEILIMSALSKFHKVTVFHHGSSAAEYIVGDNLNYIKID